MLLIGRDTLGEAVIGFLYIVPIVWAASRWGQAPGVSAALTAALCFDFLFIPPFYTFAVGSLESWLVLVFLLAILIVGRIQDSLSKMREATFMYELSSALANARTQNAVAHIVARNIRQLFQAALVNVTFQQSKQIPRIAAHEPMDGEGTGQPDRILPIMNAWGWLVRFKYGAENLGICLLKTALSFKILRHKRQGRSSARITLKWRKPQTARFQTSL
ncbi:MAG: DUF4118 domain-containing protein [Anaerolineales bacterium]|nr:DUF4118 domain-containing protein [Anaerolineales bacterium]